MYGYLYLYYISIRICLKIRDYYVALPGGVVDANSIY
jgi:hypothetical protein